MSSESRIQLENWLKQQDIHCDRVLDVGGSQYPMPGRTNSWNVKEYKILDIEQPHECKQKPDFIFDLNLEGHPLGFLEWEKKYPDREHLADGGSAYFKMLVGEKDYDVIFCIEVMEYIYDPMTALSNLYEFLKPGGKLYISFHFLYPIHKPVGCDYMRYTEEGVQKLLEVAGFKEIEIMPRVVKNRALVTAFYGSEGMRHRHDNTVDHAGYMVKAKK